MPYQQFAAPAWQTSRISALRQQFAAPQIGRLKRKMTGSMAGMGYDPQSVQARRSTIRGYGEGLGGIMARAGQVALSQYGQEYASKLAIYGGGGAGGGGGGGIVPPGQEYRTGSSRSPEQEASHYGAVNWMGQQRKMEQTANPYGYRQRGGRVGVAGYVQRTRKTKKEKGLWRPSRLMQAKARGQSIQGLREAKDWYDYLRFQVPVEWQKIPKRAKGGAVSSIPRYKVGEKGPELVKYDSGRFELVGKKGPEIRTFKEEGTVIPAGKTKKMMKSKSLFTPRQGGGRVTSAKRWLPSRYAEMMGFVPRGSWFLSRSMNISQAEWEREQNRQHKLAIALAGARGGVAAKPKPKERRFSFVRATA